MSLFQFSRFIAVFLDEKGEQVGFKVFKRSFGSRGLKITTFTYDGGSYNINPNSSRVCLDLKSHFFFDDYIYLYSVGHPDPLDYKDLKFKPLFSPDLYKNLLENKQTIDLIKAGRGGLNIDWRIILALIVGAIVIYYLFNRFSSDPVPVVETVSNITKYSMPLRT